MMQEEMWVRAEAALCADLLASNLDAAIVGARSRELVSAATGRGTLCFLADGALALAVDQKVLGSPANQATRERTLRDVGKSENGVVVVFGYGLGHVIRDLRRQTEAPIVVFDPDPSVLRTALELGPIDLGHISVICDLREFRQRFRYLSGGRSAGTLVVTPGYAEAYGETLAKLTELLGTLLSSSQVSENTLRVRTASWVRNLVDNLPRLSGTIPFGRLRAAYEGVPAFIVGAGPSLSRNKHLLSEATRKGIVFVMNSGASVLAQQGAEPQVIVCLEAVDYSSHLRDLPWIDRVNVALSLNASPKTWDAASGPIMPIYDTTPAFCGLASLLQTDPVSVAGSVSTAAFSMALLLGCSPIVLLGQDLAFTDGMIHAAGTEIESSRVRVDRDAKCIRYDWCETAERGFAEIRGAPTSEPLTEVVAWGGQGTVVASSTWNLVREWLESQAEGLSRVRPDVKLINATEGGSRIPGFDEVSLSDVLQTMPNLDITAEDIHRTAAARGPALTAEQVTGWATEQADRAAEAALHADTLQDAVAAAIATLEAAEPRKVALAYENLDKAERDLRQFVAGLPLLDAWCRAPIDIAVGSASNLEVPREAVTSARAALESEAQIAEILSTGAREMDRVLRSISTPS